MAPNKDTDNTYVDQAAEKTTDALHTIKEKAEQAQAVMGKAVYGPGVDSVDTNVDQAGDATKSGLHFSQSKTEDAHDSLKNTVDAMRETEKESYFHKVGEMGSSAYEYVKDTVNDTLQGQEESQIDNAVDTAANVTKESLHTGLDTAAQAKRKVLQAMYGKEKDDMDRFVEERANRTKEVIHSSEDALDSTRQMAQESHNESAEYIQRKTQAAKEAGEELGDTLSASAGQVENGFTNAASQVRSA